MLPPRFKTPILIVGCFLLLSRLSFADVLEIRAFFQTILSEHDENRLPISDENTWHLLDTLALSPEDVKQVLPLAQVGLKSPIKTVRELSLSLFFNCTFRPDSASLLEPFTDDIASFLTDSDLEFRRSAIVILGQQNPLPLPKAKATLIFHLGDRDNSARETGMIASALLATSPSDAGTVREIVKLVEQRPELKLSIQIIRVMGLSHVSTDEAVGFIRSHFSDTDPDVRKTCVEAVERMPKNVRDGFAPELQKMLLNSKETPEIRDRAALVLNQ
jgi:HEAT repeat protein